MVQQVGGAWGGLDVLVNNAGITRDNLIIRMAEEEWDAVLGTNLKGAFLCTKAVVPLMLKQRWGRIINMSSVVALAGNPGQANYAASKAGLIALTRSIAKEVGSRNITVNALTPGFITTDMVGTLSQETIDAIKQHIPLGRLGTPEDVAGAVAFLASDDASYLTGQAIGIDGAIAI
jgi:3-oxoacyl-[acyl-carrier protein] reductase